MPPSPSPTPPQSTHYHNHMDHTSSSNTTSTAPSSSPTLPATRYHSVQHWSLFIDNYDITAASISKHFALLANIRDLTTQRRLIEEVEQEIFDGKQQIEEIEAEVAHFPYNLRAKAQQQIETHKEELEAHYALLLHYQQSHRQGQPVAFQTQITPPTTEQQHDTDKREQEDEEEQMDDTTALLPLHSFSSSSSSASTSESSSSPSSSSLHSQHRSALLSTSSHLSAADASINRTVHNLTESSMIGTDTTLSLLQQRESLLKQRDHLYNTHVLSQRSQHSMERIRRRILSDQLLAWCIVCLQIGLFTLIAYVKYFKQ